MPLPIIIVANAAVGKPWSTHATGILAGLLAGATFLFGAIDWAGSGSSAGNPRGVDVGIMLTAVIAAALTSKPVRERAARIIPIDPDSPVHSIALVLAVILAGTQLAAIVFTDVLAADQKLPPLSIGDLIFQEAPFVVLAFAGVGLWIRRSFGASNLRLGVVAPAWWHLALAVAAAGLFYGLSQGSAELSQRLTPDLANKVNQTSQHLFGALGNQGNWAGIIALGIVPGICEEILFRGALQPRLGLITTAVLFTAIHTEYGLSIDALSILVFAIGLGLIRRYTNTTTSITCHVAYNIAVGVGLAGMVLNVAILVELVLIGLVIYAISMRRRRADEVIPETTRVR